MAMGLNLEQCLDLYRLSVPYWIGLQLPYGEAEASALSSPLRAVSALQALYGLTCRPGPRGDYIRPVRL